MKIGVISVTNQGDKIAEKLAESIDIELYSKNNIKPFDLMKISKELMFRFKAIIFISSTGIAVRAIAPFIKGKTIDPAVLVIDCMGSYVISLLSGHIGGANELTLKISQIIKAQPIITTATDSFKIDAPDIIAKENNLIIDDIKKAKDISAALIEGRKIVLQDERSLINTPNGWYAYKEKNNIEKIEGAVFVTDRLSLNSFDGLLNLINKGKYLKLIRKDIILGIGCRKNYDIKTMKDFVVNTLGDHNIDIRAVKSVTTVEIKKDEKAIASLCKFMQCSLELHTLEDIKLIQHKFSGSDFVEKSIGVRAVCEPCIELSGGMPLSGKIISSGMTLCIGQSINIK